MLGQVVHVPIDSWFVCPLFTTSCNEQCGGVAAATVGEAARQFVNLCLNPCEPGDLPSHLISLTSEKWGICALSVSVGLFLFLIDDLPFIIKKWWRLHVAAILRRLLQPQARLN